MARYLARHVKGYRVTITIGEGRNARNVRKQAVNGLLELDEVESAALDKMMLRRGDLKQNLMKITDAVDPKSVELHRQIMLKRQDKGPVAVKGAVSSAQVSREKLRQAEEARVLVPVADDKMGEYVDHSVTGEPNAGSEVRGPTLPDPGIPTEVDTGLRHPMDAAIPTQPAPKPQLGGNALGK